MTNQLVKIPRCDPQPQHMELADGLTVGEWANVGRGLRDLTESKLWWIGDWRNYADEHLSDHAKTITDFLTSEMKYCSDTIRKAAYVCKRFPSGNRFPKLSFKHHMVVAPMEQESQSMWLNRAIQKNWSASDLVQAIRLEFKDASTSQENQNAGVFMWEDWLRIGENGFKEQIAIMPLEKWDDDLIVERINQMEELQKPLLNEAERRNLPIAEKTKALEGV